MPVEPVILTGGALSLEAVEAVARRGARVEIAEEVRPGVVAAREVIDRCAAGDEPVYGVNTGFGSLARVRIDADDLRDIQRNLVRSHACGVGEPLPDDLVRATMLVLTASLCRGRSGVRNTVIDRLTVFLNRGITPIVPSRGSVGASGDLAPLAHVALVLIGEGRARFRGEDLSGADALSRVDVEPLTLRAKEGLALVNGTHLMTAMATLALRDIDRLLAAAFHAAAMAIDACRASDGPLDPRLHEVRGQLGQRRVAEILRGLVEGSEIIPSHREDDPRVQDPYCLRAAPQVLGAVVDALDWSRSVIERELGAVTDNPLVFADADDDAILAGGNFHGMPLAMAMDHVTVALCHVAGIAERRINWLLTASDSENPVNVYLSPQPGLHSGLMLVQYVAAACCNELQSLAHPSSVANIPTSAGMEDYNSMGATSGHQLRQAVELARHVVAGELLVMAEALEYHRPLRSGAAVERAHATVRTVVPRLEADRPPAPDLAALAAQIERGAYGA